MSISGSKSGNMAPFSAMVRAQFCTAVGSGCSGLLGNDYSYAEDASKSSWTEQLSLGRCSSFSFDLKRNAAK
jgi:hypothetical protein